MRGCFIREGGDWVDELWNWVMGGMGLRERIDCWLWRDHGRRKVGGGDSTVFGNRRKG